MNNISLVQLNQLIAAFASAHPQLQRYFFEAEDNMSVLTTEDQSFPVLYATLTPAASELGFTQNIFGIRLYCLDIIEKSRENWLTINSDCHLILNDLYRFLLDGDYPFEVQQNIPALVEWVNDGTMDYVAGCFIELDIYADTYTDCFIPIDGNVVFSGGSGGFVLQQFLTCDSLENCSTFNNEIDNLQNQIDNLTGSSSNFFTTGGTYNSLTEEIDFVGNDASTTFSVDVSLLLDETNTFITGGTLSSGILSLDRNDGNTVSVTGFTDNFTTGATLVGNVVVFDRNDQLSAYTVNIESVTDNFLPLTGGTLTGSLSATTYFGDGSNLTGILSTDNFTTGGTYNSILESIDFSGTSSATTFSIDVSALTPFDIGCFGLTIDGAGSAITTGIKGSLIVPYPCTIDCWGVIADQSGSVVIDVWKGSSLTIPTSASDSIAGTEKPTLSSQQINTDLTLTTWTTGLVFGDVLVFNVDSASTLTRVTLQIKVIKL